MTTQHDLSAALLAPDFYHYVAAPIAAVTEGDDAIVVCWSDGRQLSCHRFWLRENTLGDGGIDPATREGIMDPAELSDAMQIAAFELTESGDLRLTWAPEGKDEGVVSTYHSGWLRHIAEGQHLPESWVPAPEAWNASTLPAPPRRVRRRHAHAHANALAHAHAHAHAHAPPPNRAAPCLAAKWARACAMQ